MGIITPPDADALPFVPEEKRGVCIRCGHCEAYCPTGALQQSSLPVETTPSPEAAATVDPEALGSYLRMRRSVRHFSEESVSKEKFEAILDIARYAASGGNGQPIEWLVIRDPQEVRRLAGLTIDWMKTLVGTDHPMSGYIPSLLAAWKHGYDPICRSAPHLIIAHVPEGNAVASIDALISLTHVDLAAPTFGVGTCWAGFLSMAANAHEPLVEALALPPGRKYGYALLCGIPKYKPVRIPRRNPQVVVWR